MTKVRGILLCDIFVYTYGTSTDIHLLSCAKTSLRCQRLFKGTDVSDG